MCLLAMVRMILFLFWRPHIKTNTNTNTHTYIYTHIHTYIHTHKCHSQMLQSNKFADLRWNRVDESHVVQRSVRACAHACASHTTYVATLERKRAQLCQRGESANERRQRACERARARASEKTETKKQARNRTVQR